MFFFVFWFQTKWKLQPPAQLEGWCCTQRFHIQIFILKTHFFLSPGAIVRKGVSIQTCSPSDGNVHAATYIGINHLHKSEIHREFRYHGNRLSFPRSDEFFQHFSFAQKKYAQPIESCKSKNDPIFAQEISSSSCPPGLMLYPIFIIIMFPWACDSLISVSFVHRWYCAWKWNFKPSTGDVIWGRATTYKKCRFILFRNLHSPSSLFQSSFECLQVKLQLKARSQQKSNPIAWKKRNQRKILLFLFLACCINFVHSTDLLQCSYVYSCRGLFHWLD